MKKSIIRDANICCKIISIPLRGTELLVQTHENPNLPIFAL